MIGRRFEKFHYLVAWTTFVTPGRANWDLWKIRSQGFGSSSVNDMGQTGFKNNCPIPPPVGDNR
jgi:hypothetical protein